MLQNFQTMKQLKIIFILSIFSLLTFRAMAQVFRVPLNMYVQDEKSVKLKSVIAIYSYTGQPFEDPINNGVETKKEAGKFNAVLPNMSGVRDTSYGFIFYGGISDRKDLPGYTLIVLGNNRRQSGQNALLWIDKNHNLDLSDDGAPDTLIEGKPIRDIELVHPKYPNAIYTVNLERVPIGRQAPYITMLQDYYLENSGSKKFESIIYSFAETRFNTIAGDFKYRNDSFRIGVKDFNCNGLYNDEQSDYLLLGPWGQEVMPDNRIEWEEKKTFFEHNGVRYNVKKIDRIGAYVELERDTITKLQNSLVVGKKIKKFKFQRYVNGEVKKTRICKYRRKLCYIYVWNTNQDSVKSDTAILRTIANLYGDKIHVIGLNYGQTPKHLSVIQKRFGLPWVLGQSTMQINEILFLESIPYGILTSKRLRVKEIKISPRELLTLLQNNLI